RPSRWILSPFGSPSYSTTTSHSRSGDTRRIRPNARSTRYRLPARSNDGPSRKKPGLPAFAVGAAFRSDSGIVEDNSVSMIFGGGPKYMGSPQLRSVDAVPAASPLQGDASPFAVPHGRWVPLGFLAQLELLDLLAGSQRQLGDEF